MNIEAVAYLEDCLNEICTTGKTVIDEHGFAHLKAAYNALLMAEIERGADHE